jgi:SAM-dependent methyltransferase
MDHAADMQETARFFDLAIREIAGLQSRQSVSVLDFGCGAGDMMQALSALGYQCHGCDIVLYPEVRDRSEVKLIAQQPYRIPFESGSFDIVLSASVLEHALNPDECYAEINRVLKPGGCAMHIFPTKWYLPAEPHIFIPLANYLWPHCPTWWIALWVLLGCRAPAQKGEPWRVVLAQDRQFLDHGVIYLTTRTHSALSRRHFAAHAWPMAFYIAHAHGGFARHARRLPFPQLWGWLSREFRMGFLVQHKHAGVTS